MTRLMGWIVILAVLLLLGGTLAQMMIADAGVIMIAWHGWLIETTFWSGLALIISLLIAILGFVALWRKLGPNQMLSRYRLRRDQKAAKKETAIAITSWLGGDDDRALTALQRVADAGGSDRLPQAIALAIGLTHGEWPERYAAFVAGDPELKLFAQTLQAERCWQAKDYGAFVTLLQAHSDLAQVSWLRERFWQALYEQAHYAALLTGVNEAAHIQPQLREHWLIKTVTAALQQAQGDETALVTILKPLAKAQRNLPDILVAEIGYLASIGQHANAFKRAKNLLERPGQSERSALLIDLQIANLDKLSWLENHTPVTCGPIFCRTLGLVNLQQQLWGSAQSWLEQGWQQQDRQSGLKLAELFEQRNMTDQAQRIYKQLAQRPHTNP
jgi:HemY protein